MPEDFWGFWDPYNEILPQGANQSINQSIIARFHISSLSVTIAVVTCDGTETITILLTRVVIRFNRK
jgi:hypothetical protein